MMRPVKSLKLKTKDCWEMWEPEVFEWTESVNFVLSEHLLQVVRRPRMTDGLSCKQTGLLQIPYDAAFPMISYFRVPLS